MTCKSICREYCSWEPIVMKDPCGKGELYVRGDLNGKFNYSKERKEYFGFFEFPAKGEEKNQYEIVKEKNGAEEVVEKVKVKYTFNDKYFSPRWENVNEINDFLVERYSAVAEKEIIYTYTKFQRDIQLLKITSPATGGKNKQTVLLTGRMHNPESGMTAVLYRFIKWLLEDEGQKYLKDYLFLIVPLTIPITFDEDPRQHNVNREWQPEITEPDIAALRDKVIDKYIPEVWIDCHSFNDILRLDDPGEKRKGCGDYVVAHPVGETFFDRPYSQEIALTMIKAGEKAGHVHRDKGFFQWWAKWAEQNLPCKKEEKVITEHHDAGIFSAKDYAKYADRCKFGVSGRDWPAMACEYGYFRCHAVNMCFECKPLHVNWGSGTIHYSSKYPDSHLVKLKELCRIGLKEFSGQPYGGFPCNIIAADTALLPDSVMLCARGGNREKIRLSRKILWQNRRSIVVFKPFPAQDGTSLIVRLECIRDIRAEAYLRFKAEKGEKIAFADGKKHGKIIKKNDYFYLPITVSQGIVSLKIKKKQKNN